MKTRKEVERMRARLDPQAERDRQQARDGRMVDFSPHPRVLGITELDANLDAVDAHHLQATLDMLAHTLKRGGATESMDELRSIALGHLAHPDRAARLPRLRSGLPPQVEWRWLGRGDRGDHPRPSRRDPHRVSRDGEDPARESLSSFLCK